MTEFAQDQPAKLSDPAAASSEDPKYIRSIGRAFLILQVLSRRSHSSSLAQIADETNLPRTTLTRLLQTLSLHGIVEQSKTTRRYTLGTSLIPLGYRADRQSDMEATVQPYLQDLANATGETASFAILRGTSVVYVAQVLSPHIIRAVQPIGCELELTCTGVGKALLSSFGVEQLDQIICKNGLPQYTEKSIVTAEHLRKEIEAIEHAGYAISDEEIECGKRCIAAPVFDPDGRAMAAVSITGPAERMPHPRMESLAETVKETAAKISREFGLGEPLGEGHSLAL